MKTKICLIMVLLLVFSVSLSWAEKKSDVLPAESIRIEPVSQASYHPVLEKAVEKEVGEKIHRIIPEGKVYRDPPAPDQSEYLLWQDNFEDEDLISYYAGANYYWMIPDEAVEYGVRFTARRAGTLDGAWFYWYFGSTAPQATVHVYADDLTDGTGYPGTELGSVTVTANLTSWNYIDLTSLGINVTTTEDFFITYSVAPGDTLSIISDNGTGGANRSLEVLPSSKAWSYMIDDWGTDYEWNIDAVIGVTPDPWTPSFVNTWQTVTSSSHSPTHSQWIDDDPANAGNNLLTSPPFTCPDGYGRLLLSYWYNSDLVDGYYPEHDYWAFSIGKTADAVSWHSSTYNAYVRADSWYAGSEILHEYGTNAIYYLYTPEIDLTGATSAELTCVIDYDTEEPGGEDPPYDGWDVANVQISTDNWATYGFLEDPLHPYNVSIAYAGYWNTNNPADTLSYPGWGGANVADVGDWFNATFDMSDYFGETVHIRFALASDPYTVADGYWVDNVDVTVNSSIVFSDYNETNLLPDPPIIPLEELEHNDVTASWTESNRFDITTYAGDEIVLEIRVKLDADTLAKADGDGFWFDDPTIFGYNLPDHDCGAMCNVIPYPQTVGVNVEPGIVYGNFGLTTEGPYLRIDVEGLGATPFDYYNNSTDPIATNEYNLEYLTKVPTFNLVAGTHSFKGWTEVGFDEDPSNDTTFINIEVLPAGQYELGYNSRVWTGTYYTSSYCGSYFTPYADGIFSTKGSAYVINAVNVLLLNMGTDYATDTETIEIFEAIDDVTPGNLIYTESFAYTGGVGGSNEWVTFTLTTPQTITSDFFVMISGDWYTDPVNANYYPVFDDMIRQYVTQPYVINTVYGDGPTDPWYHSSGARFVNTIGTTIEWIFPPVVNIAISGNDVVLTWAAVSDATDYKVYRSSDPYTGFTELVGTTGGATTYTDTGGAAGTKYFYQVTGF